MAITAKAIMENNNIGHNLSLHSGAGHGQAGHHSTHQSGLSGFFPETTISPMSGPPPSGGHLRNLEPMQPMALKSVIKTEPVAYIKREDNNNAPNLMQLHPPHHMLNDGYLLHHTSSPMSSMSSPGSPPGINHEKNQVAMAMASLSSGGGSGGAGPRMGPGGHLLPQSPPHPHAGGHHTPAPPSQHHGGGKMRTPTPSTSRKKSANEPTPEEEELANIPSLQMRIKILQQRVRLSYIFIYQIINHSLL